MKSITCCEYGSGYVMNNSLYFCRSFSLPFSLSYCVCVRVFCLSIYLLASLSVFTYRPLCLCVCLSAYLPVCLSAHLPVCPPACLPAYLSACLHVLLSACLPVCLSSGLSVCPTVCLPVRLSGAHDRLCKYYLRRGCNAWCPCILVFKISALLVSSQFVISVIYYICIDATYVNFFFCKKNFFLF